MRAWVVGLVLLLSSSSVFGQQYDVLIRNGRVVDGTGNPCMPTSASPVIASAW
jgi:hypothetical protein